MKKFLAFISLVFIFIPSPSAARPWVQTLDSVLTTLAEQGMFNGQVLLAEKGNIVFNNGYGEYENTSISTTSPLPVASISKSMTAFGIMILKEQGKIDYDDKITAYLPKIPFPNVTVQQLLNQTSGIPNFLSTALDYGDTTRVMNQEEILELISRIRPPAGKAGEKFYYNNSNYLLCRSIIENVSGMSYADFMKHYVWNPLGMDHTHTDARVNLPADAPINADNFYNPGSGIHSTAGDLFRFAHALKSNTVISHKSVEEAFSRPLLNDGTKSNYGFGWYILETPDGKSVGHWGRGEGVKTYLELYLTEEKTLVMLTVHSTSYVDQTYQVIRDIWAGNPYELPTRIQAYDIDPKLYKEYTGSYLTPNLGLLHVSVENGKLYLRPDPVPGKEELVPSSDSTFYFRNQDLEWQFYRDGNGEVIGFGFKGDRKEMGMKQK